MPGDLQNISVTATGRRLKAFEVDATHCPDLFPILAVLAAHCDGTSRIAGVGRLTQKESNRAETIYAEFRTLGARIDIRGDEMFVTGGPLHGGDVRSHNDHRIAMSLIVARVVHAGAGAAGRREVHRQVVSFVPRSARPAGVAGRADGISVPAERTLSVRRSAETDERAGRLK